MRRYAVTALMLPLMLGGCGLPPAITAVAYLIDGASLVGTGKTVSDHAISAFAQEDCALFRVVQGELVCQGPGEQGKRSAIAMAADKTVYPGDAPGESAASTEQLAAASAAHLQIASTAPTADAANSRSAGWAPVLTIGDAAIPVSRRWPIVAMTPAPIGAAPTAATSQTATPRMEGAAMIRAHRRLLEFRSPIELLAQQPCADCSTPVPGNDG